MTPLLPLDPQVLASLGQYFQKVSLFSTGLVTLLFVARICFLVLSVAGPSSYGELLKDTLLYFVFINLFPRLLSIVNEITGTLATKLYWEPTSVEEGAVNTVFTALKSTNPLFGVFFDFSPLIICHLAQSISTLLISVLVAIGPIVILLNTLLGLNRGITIYASALLSFFLWPVLWNLLGSLSNEILAPSTGTSLMRVLFWVSVSFIQFISPLICITLFSSFAPGKSISTGVTRIVSKFSIMRI